MFCEPAWYASMAWSTAIGGGAQQRLVHGCKSDIVSAQLRLNVAFECSRVAGHSKVGRSSVRSILDRRLPTQLDSAGELSRSSHCSPTSSLQLSGFTCLPGAVRREVAPVADGAIDPDYAVMALDADASLDEAMHSGRLASVAGILDQRELQVRSLPKHGACMWLTALPLTR